MSGISDFAIRSAPFPVLYPSVHEIEVRNRVTRVTAVVREKTKVTMPVVEKDDAPVVFRVVHHNGVEKELVGWDGGLYASVLGGDHRDRKAVGFEDFTRSLTEANPYHSKTFNPFVDRHQQVGVLGGKRSGHPFLASYAAGVVAPSGTVIRDGSKSALRQASRLSGELALIGGVVHFRVLAPMWQGCSIAALDGETFVAPEWRIPAFPSSTWCGTLPRTMGDLDDAVPRSGGGQMFAWDREAAADAFGACSNRSGRLMKGGAIEVVDRSLASALVRPGEDLVVTARETLEDAWKYMAADFSVLSDDALTAWKDLRRACKALNDAEPSDVAAARSAFQALEAVAAALPVVETSDPYPFTFAKAAKKSLQRWRLFDRDFLMPEDDEAIAGFSL